MRFAFDMDGVFGNFHTPYMKLINDYFHKNYPTSYDANDKWNTYDQFEDFAPEMQAEIFECIRNLENFWLDTVQPFNLEDLKLVKDLLWNGDNVYFITNRHPNPDEDTTLSQCRNWLLKYDIYPTGIILTKNKAEACNFLQIDYFIDDHVENVKDVANNCENTVSYIMDRKHNQDYKTIFRAKTIKEFIERAKEGYYNGENG